ncbi:MULTISPECIES: NADP-dependent oxidoreductase [Pseudomonas]|uniref:Alcohol dehydrogenase GroES-like domain/oxidoreductase n=1 Tax=Pseudomonas cichorii TaxID=36746 RepID=A0A3M4VJB7_PSECI|nr:MULTISPECIES: NADP-dependent oxidoreductase [Pseudomonas]AHF67900.1 alcohol dehydrogenase GroES-like domain/oxidoreductase, zinc-binding dehydrogenase family protein [Pseudomonas cichorii JBC1]QVE14976.1 NADP-dependent oxidoreductase [Pseudomonas cichorii]RMR51938.1 Alcohol dehydrogenase GroES-like domain/oxidoreductase [Pseudomonas cichorii]SDO67709.1 NADPH:quinone reductase [Pseudomonas cichorii]GFM75323.1 NADPH:quinone oxidoreductase [Pseudomonas cichorii]
MKAFFIERYGKNSGRFAELPDPQVGPNDVLVQVHATSVNLLDSKIRKGEFKLILPYSFPLVLGNDLAGVVVRTGAGVRHFKPGDEVYARPPQERIGTFAELICVKEDSLALKPKNISMEEAASVPLVALTAWQVLVETARVKKGQKVLIHAGSGGVGTIAIQLAKHLGAFVATTTSTSNVQWVKALGADVVIDYTQQSFESELHDYDVVLNSLGPDVLERSLKVLKPGGQLISISGPPTPLFADEQKLSWGLKQIMRVLSYGIRKKAREFDVSYAFVFMQANGAQLREISTLIESGAIKPVIDRSFPLESTAEALSYVEQGRSKGKVVINVR